MKGLVRFLKGYKLACFGVVVFMFVQVAAAPVSYTHLDVYKRQVQPRPHDARQLAEAQHHHLLPGKRDVHGRHRQKRRQQHEHDRLDADASRGQPPRTQHHGAGQHRCV